MPFKTEWAPPAVFLKHRDVTIHRLHKDEDMEVFMRAYACGYDEQCSDESDFAFDVRELPKLHHHDVNHPHGCRAIMHDAINAGILTQDGIQGDSACPDLTT